jgi:hypothetical protein
MAFLINAKYNRISTYFILLLISHLHAVINVAIHYFADGNPLVHCLEVGDIHPEGSINIIDKVNLLLQLLCPFF